MKFYKSLTFILLANIIISCGSTEDNLSIDESKIKAQYTTNDKVDLSVLNTNNVSLDSIVYSANNKKIGVANGKSNFTFDLKNEKLGYQNIKAVSYYDNATETDSTRIEIVSALEPKLLTYTIVNTFPHDVKAYTQGLEFHRDTLYEGTGNGAGNGTGIRGISSLRKTDFKTGKIYKNVELAEQYFGEGITIFNNKVYQLTWQNNEGYVYDADTFKKLKTFTYFKKIEGWGLTHDDNHLYQSDGSEKIYKLDPETLKEVDYINVYSSSTKIKEVNELEYVDGYIYGNVYGKDAIAVIDAKSGAVVGIMDMSELKKKITMLPDTDVLNGIAYNPKTKTFFVTGKNWDKMFEIKINN